MRAGSSACDEEQQRGNGGQPDTEHCEKISCFSAGVVAYRTLACYRTASALETVDGTTAGGEALLAPNHDDAQKILIVEDDHDIREGLTSFLEDRGYEVVTAPNGLAALEKLRWGLRPCVSWDLRMP